jgi:hypothetical protein
MRPDREVMCLVADWLTRMLVCSPTVILGYFIKYLDQTNYSA